MSYYHFQTVQLPVNEEVEIPVMEEDMVYIFMNFEF